ncbi:hypothetical protein [Xanthomonas sp. CFBP 8445]|uniref:hypothetical protein n=1 Tax=Xanthomonas sp. CFBP 8445 TaxID=2971236 RepID=UPI0021E07630|nr:hypothetical protein [Xanthomonas sp. CFBP 8445]UYC12217.1 hypothetical protein NUG21_00230 [Xanthomonas sp. CFBP 8445]
MDTWKPITADGLSQLIERELAGFNTTQQEAFKQIKMAPRATPIVRGGNVESVFVVPEHGDEVMYYEDVEEGFNVSLLDSTGFIANPGSEQWELSHALHHWLGA